MPVELTDEEFLGAPTAPAVKELSDEEFLGTPTASPASLLLKPRDYVAPSLAPKPRTAPVAGLAEAPPPPGTPAIGAEDERIMAPVRKPLIPPAVFDTYLKYTPNLYSALHLIPNDISRQILDGLKESAVGQTAGLTSVGSVGTIAGIAAAPEIGIPAMIAEAEAQLPDALKKVRDAKTWKERASAVGDVGGIVTMIFGPAFAPKGRAVKPPEKPISPAGPVPPLPEAAPEAAITPSKTVAPAGEITLTPLQKSMAHIEKHNPHIGDAVKYVVDQIADGNLDEAERVLKNRVRAADIINQGEEGESAVFAVADHLQKQIDARRKPAEPSGEITAKVGTVAEPPIPEAPATLQEQVRLAADPASTRAAALITSGAEFAGQVPEGMRSTLTKHGTVIYNPSKVTESQVLDAAKGDVFDNRILGGASGTKPVQGDTVVTTKTPAADDVQTELVPTGDAAAVEAAKKAQQAAVPGGTTEVKPAVEVLDKREAENAIQKRGAEAVPVEVPPGNRPEVGARIPSPEKPAEAQAAAKNLPPQEPVEAKWDKLREDLTDNLDSFSPARETGRRNYAQDDMVDRFVEFAKADKTGKPLGELVKDFAKSDEASQGQLRKLRAAVKDLESQEPVKPELPKPSANDYLDRNKVPGEHYRAKPNSIIIQFRGLDTNPIQTGKPFELPFTGDLKAAGKAIMDAFRQAVNQGYDISYRESIKIATDAKGNAIYHFRVNPTEGTVSATTHAELVEARRRYREMTSGTSEEQPPPKAVPKALPSAEPVKGAEKSGGASPDSEAISTAAVEAQKAVQEWGKHYTDVVEPLRKAVSKLHDEASEMQISAKMSSPEYKGKGRMTRKAFFQKYGVANKEEANALWKKINDEWQTKTDELEAAEKRGKELERLKDSTGKAWSRAVTRSKEKQPTPPPPVKLTPKALPPAESPAAPKAKEPAAEGEMRGASAEKNPLTAIVPSDKPWNSRKSISNEYDSKWTEPKFNPNRQEFVVIERGTGEEHRVEPWEITEDEFVDAFPISRGENIGVFAAWAGSTQKSRGGQYKLHGRWYKFGDEVPIRREHQRVVEEAVKQGKPVPEYVLNYPFRQGKPQQPTPPPPSPTGGSGSLYREASVEDVLSYVDPNFQVRHPFGPPDTFVSTSLDLAKGQRKGASGIMVEIDPSGMEVRNPSRQKPGSEIVSKMGGGEEKVIRVQPNELGKNIVSIRMPNTLARDAFSIRLKRYLDSNWDKRTGGNETIYTPKSQTGGEMRPGPGEGPGARTAGTPPTGGSQIEQLASAFANKAPAAERAKQLARESFAYGERAGQAKDALSRALAGLRNSGQALWTALTKFEKPDELLKAKGVLSAELETRGWRVREFAKNVQRAIPDKRRRAAIAKWIDSGGDDARLTLGESATKPQFKQAYRDARNLTPEEKVHAQNIQNYFEARLDEAIDAGVLEQGLEDYLHRIYPKDSATRQKAIAYVQSGILSKNPSLARKRFYEWDYEAEAAGLRPVQDFLPRLTDYETSLSKAIAARAFVGKATQMVAADGRPLIGIKGLGIPVEDQNGVRTGTVIKPLGDFRKAATPGTPDYRGDYKVKEYPALSRWKWVAEDTDGKPIFVQGDVAIHPDFVSRFESLLEPSHVRYGSNEKLAKLGRGALGASTTVKQTMLDLSGFHQVQIGLHAMEHRVFPWQVVKTIDFADPKVEGLLKGGVTLGGEFHDANFGEGLFGKSLSQHVPILGPLAETYHNWLFQSFIPRVKMTMALHALERNRIRYAKDLASGRMTEDDLNLLTAKQANAAFGELNYIMLERNKTIQDMARLTLLAPDFLEARGRFVAQALTKYGTEQRVALLLGAATLFTLARVANKIADDQYHWEPENLFSLVYKNRAYSLRTVQGDVLHLLDDPITFWMNRLNPTFSRFALEAVSHRDQFGRKRSVPEAMLDTVKNIQPIATRFGRERKLWESIMSAFGGTVRRWNDVDKAFKMAQEWKSANNIQQRGEFIYDPEKDPLRPLKIALSYGEPDAVQELVKMTPAEVQKARDYFQRYINMPFTGSRDNDVKWMKTLSTDQRQTVEAARLHRQDMGRRFMSALAQYRSLRANPPTAP